MNGLVAVPLTAKQRQQLRSARLARGLSQEELGKAIGCSERSIVRIENGPFRPTPVLLKKVCRKLGFTWQLKIGVRLIRKR